MENETKVDETIVAEVIPPKNGRESFETRTAPASENSNSNPKEAPLVRVRGGPRTPIGKERSRRNAVKHGILARTVVLEGESHKKFVSLLQGLRGDFQPSGTLENLLVEKLASLAWRYRRMLVTERAEIRLGTRFNPVTAEQKRLERQEALMLFSSMERPGPGVADWDNPIIRARYIELLKTVETFVKARGFKPDFDVPILRLVFGDSTLNGLQYLYTLCSQPEIPVKGTEFKDFDLSPEGRKEKFLEVLRDYTSGKECFSKHLKRLSDYREKMEAKRSGVPEAPRLDRMLRYEAALERAFDRTLNQLERLQRMRLGKPVPPPINVNISNS